MTTPAPAEDNSGKKSKKPLMVAGLVGGVVLLTAGGALAWNAFDGGGEQPYEHLAPGAIAYAQTNLNPSADQKLAIRELSKKFPEAENNNEEFLSLLTEDNINGALFAEAIESKKDYDFFGDRMALAAYPTSKDEDPDIAFIAQVEDEDEAKAALKEMLAYAKKNQNEDFSGEVKDGYMMASSAPLEDVFNTSESLADEATFEDYKEFEDMALSGWGDVGALAEAGTGSGDDTDAEETPEITGTAAFGLNAREDGLDFQANSYDITANGKKIEVGGDTEITKALVEANSYDDALLTLGITGLGDMAKAAADASGEDVGSFSPVLGNDDIPALLGNNASLSLAYEQESINGRLVFKGVNTELLRQTLEGEGYTADSLESLLQQQVGDEAEVLLDKDVVTITVGQTPTGGPEVKAGHLTGMMNLDSLYTFFSSFSPEQEKAEEGLGIVEFNALNQGDGNGSLEISWTTPR